MGQWDSGIKRERKIRREDRERYRKEKVKWQLVDGLERVGLYIYVITLLRQDKDVATRFRLGNWKFKN